MNKYHYLFIIGFIISTVTIAQQSIFDEDFSINPVFPTDWPFTGNHFSHSAATSYPSTAGTIEIINGKLELRALRGEQTRRFQKDIGTTLSNSDKWTLDVDIDPHIISPNNEVIIALTDHSSEHWHTDNYPIWFITPNMTTGPHTVNTVNSIHLRYYHNGTGYRIQVRTKEGSSFVNSKELAATGGPLYVRLERYADDRLKLSLFSNQARTILKTFSTPICMMLDNPIGDLKTIQVTVDPLASTSIKADVDIDNIVIYDDTFDPDRTSIDPISSPSRLKFDNVQRMPQMLCSSTAPSLRWSDEFSFSIDEEIYAKHFFEKALFEYGDGRYDVFDELPPGNVIRYHYPSGTPTTPKVAKIHAFYYTWDGDDLTMHQNTEIHSGMGGQSSCISSIFSTSRQISGMMGNCPSASMFVDNRTFGTVRFENTDTIMSQHIISFIDFGDCTGPRTVLNPGEVKFHTYDQSGTYTACLTVFGYYYDFGTNEVMLCNQPEQVCNTFYVDITQRLKSPNAITEEVEELSFSVYPNPVSENLNIELEEGVNQVRIIDVTGKLVVERQVIDQKNTVINMAQLPQGVYIVTVQNGEQTQTQKVIKQ